MKLNIAQVSRLQRCVGSAATIILIAFLLGCGVRIGPIHQVSLQQANEIRAAKLQVIFAEANAWVGTPYKYGGNNRSGIDCSHLVQRAYSTVIPGYQYRTAQQYLGDPMFFVTPAPAAGDLIVFPATPTDHAHVGIITDVAAQSFVGAQSGGVAETSYSQQSYWGKRPYTILSSR